MNVLIHRPITVAMCLIAIVVMGCLALRYIPVSLMPDIDVPQITVQANMPGCSAREIDEEVGGRGKRYSQRVQNGRWVCDDYL